MRDISCRPFHDLSTWEAFLRESKQRAGASFINFFLFCCLFFLFILNTPLISTNHRHKSLPFPHCLSSTPYVLGVNAPFKKKKKNKLQFHFLNSFSQGGLLQGKCKCGIPGYIPWSLSLTIFGLDEFIFKPNPSGNAFIKLSTTKYEMQYLARRLRTCDQEPSFRTPRHGIHFPILCDIK